MAHVFFPLFSLGLSRSLTSLTGTERERMVEWGGRVPYFSSPLPLFSLAPVGVYVGYFRSPATSEGMYKGRSTFNRYYLPPPPSSSFPPSLPVRLKPSPVQKEKEVRKTRSTPPFPFPSQGLRAERNRVRSAGSSSPPFLIPQGTLFRVGEERDNLPLLSPLFFPPLSFSRAAFPQHAVASSVA